MRTGGGKPTPKHGRAGNSLHPSNARKNARHSAPWRGSRQRRGSRRGPRATPLPAAAALGTVDAPAGGIGDGRPDRLCRSLHPPAPSPGVVLHHRARNARTLSWHLKEIHAQLNPSSPPMGTCQCPVAEPQRSGHCGAAFARGASGLYQRQRELLAGRSARLGAGRSQPPADHG